MSKHTEFKILLLRGVYFSFCALQKPGCTRIWMNLGVGDYIHADTVLRRIHHLSFYLDNERKQWFHYLEVFLFFSECLEKPECAWVHLSLGGGFYTCWNSFQSNSTPWLTYFDNEYEQMSHYLEVFLFYESVCKMADAYVWSSWWSI